MSAPTPPDGPVFAAPYAAPPVGTLAAPPEQRPRRPLGALALALAIVAAFVASGVGGFAAFRIARGAGAEMMARSGSGFDLRVLSPVRDIVLLGEAAFWSGTVVGVTALVLGIVATVRNRGRGAAIAAIVVSVVGPIVFVGLVLIALAAGAATVSATGGMPV